MTNFRRIKTALDTMNARRDIWARPHKSSAFKAIAESDFRDSLLQVAELAQSLVEELESTPAPVLEGAQEPPFAKVPIKRVQALEVELNRLAGGGVSIRCHAALDAASELVKASATNVLEDDVIVPATLWEELIGAVAPDEKAARLYRNRIETVIRWAIIDAQDAKQLAPVPHPEETPAHPGPDWEEVACLDHDGTGLVVYPDGKREVFDGGWLSDVRSRDMYIAGARSAGSKVFRRVPVETPLSSETPQEWTERWKVLPGGHLRMTNDEPALVPGMVVEKVCRIVPAATLTEKAQG